MSIPRKILEEKLRKFLTDDIGLGDVTAQAVIPENLTAKAAVFAKEDGIVAGIEEAVIMSESLGLNATAKVSDGDSIKNKQILLEISGNAQTILSLERTLLNLLSRMSGIATATYALTQKLKQSGSMARIAATRKSAPGLLYFDKKAVTLGGGDPHRLHLDDMILIKDNHLALIGSVEEAVKKAKSNASFSKKIEVETANAEDALKAAKAGADIIMLDNFSPKQVKDAVKKLRNPAFSKLIIEVSGGITSENLLEYAAAQIDIISMGELTHAAKALDISLEIVKKE